LKLPPNKTSTYFEAPEVDRTGVLIYGPDAMRVALKRQALVKALIGPNGEEEMRLSRISASELRKDPALLSDATKSQSFFPGPRVALLEDASDTIIKIVSATVEDWVEGDAQIVISAGQLRATSGLRKLFEAHANAYAAAIYVNPPTQQEIQAQLDKAGFKTLSSDANQAITALSRTIEPGDFQQTMEKLALYKMSDATPLTVQDIDACAPISQEAGLNDVLNCVAEGRSDQIGPIIERLVSQGTQPVALCISATRHFKALFAVASDPSGIGSGIGKLRPPVYGPRRDHLQRQAGNWGVAKSKLALEMLTDVDLILRSAGQNAPGIALVERVMIRLAMMVTR
jgi:DNA polymerase-3 subunit delta